VHFFVCFESLTVDGDDDAAVLVSAIFGAVVGNGIGFAFGVDIDTFGIYTPFGEE
jgi:hypothetical protein